MDGATQANEEDCQNRNRAVKSAPVNETKELGGVGANV